MIFARIACTSTTLVAAKLQIRGIIRMRIERQNVYALGPQNNVIQ